MIRPVPHSHAMRRDTAAAWTAANPTLDAGEEGYETDTRRRKVGDGATAWTGLGYAGLIASSDMAFSDNGDGTGLITWDGASQSASVPLLDDGKMSRDVVPAPTSDDISDATDVGKAVLTAADQAAAQTALGVGGGTAPDVQDFTASGTYTLPDGAKLVCVEIVDGGAGGGTGGDGAYTDAPHNQGGAGGSGGARRDVWLDAAKLPSSVTVTVGAGGAGAHGTLGEGKTGSPGGLSAFGDIKNTSAATATTGGVSFAGTASNGAAPSGQSVDFGGASGGKGANLGATAGTGGAAATGGGNPYILLGGAGGDGGAPGTVAGQPGHDGDPGQAPGGGGGGGGSAAYANQGGTGVSPVSNGGAGARGQVRITTYF